MFKKLLGRLLLFLTGPIRFAVRHELTRMNRGQRKAERSDVREVMQRIATESTARYVAKEMQKAEALAVAWPPLDFLTRALEQADLTADKLVCEFGVYTGTTINHVASLTDATVFGFDSFEGLPEQWRDGRGKGCFGVSDLPEVGENVTLVKGWFQDTLPSFLEQHGQNVGFLHIDCDLYSSTKTIFESLIGRIEPGCIIVFDEYFNYPGWEEGEHKAFMEFIDETGLSFEYIYYNRLHEQVAVKILSRAGDAHPRWSRFIDSERSEEVVLSR